MWGWRVSASWLRAEAGGASHPPFALWHGKTRQMRQGGQQCERTPRHAHLPAVIIVIDGLAGSRPDLCQHVSHILMLLPWWHLAADLRDPPALTRSSADITAAHAGRWRVLALAR